MQRDGLRRSGDHEPLRRALERLRDQLDDLVFATPALIRSGARRRRRARLAVALSTLGLVVACLLASVLSGR